MKCDICGKKQMSGNKVSHSNIKTRTRQKPNIKKVRALVKGRVKRIQVCTRCLRSGYVVKPA